MLIPIQIKLEPLWMSTYQTFLWRNTLNVIEEFIDHVIYATEVVTQFAHKIREIVFYIII